MYRYSSLTNKQAALRATVIIHLTKACARLIAGAPSRVCEEKLIQKAIFLRAHNRFINYSLSLAYRASACTRQLYTRFTWKKVTYSIYTHDESAPLASTSREQLAASRLTNDWRSALSGARIAPRLVPIDKVQHKRRYRIIFSQRLTSAWKLNSRAWFPPSIGLSYVYHVLAMQLSR